MKKLILEVVLLIVIPLILILGIGEYSLRKIPNDYSYKNNWLQENSASTKILILGSSHTFFGINPRYFNLKAFNCAQVSQSPKYDYLIFNKFINNMDSVKFIVLPFTFFSLYSKLEDDDEKWRANYYYLYFKFENKDNNIENQFFIFNKNPEKWTHVIKSLLKIKNEEISCDNLGYGLSYSSKNKLIDWQNTGIVHAKRHSRKINSMIAQENKDYIEAIISKCKSKNIKVILLTTPTWHTYRENLNQNQLKVMNDFCKLISLKYHNVVYLNLFDDKRFYSKDFFDADHLCDIGAEKLTKILNDTLKVLY